MRCDDCLENYCKACFKRLHRKGKKARHQWRGFRINAPVCIECEVEVARKKCSHCQDLYCLSCAKTSHAKGKKKAHVMVDVQEEFTGEGVGKYCHECDYREGAEVCPLSRVGGAAGVARRGHRRARPLARHIPEGGAAGEGGEGGAVGAVANAQGNVQPSLTWVNTCTRT